MLIKRFKRYLKFSPARKKQASKGHLLAFKFAQNRLHGDSIFNYIKYNKKNYDFTKDAD